MEQKAKIFADKIIENIGKVIIGKNEVIKLILTAMVAEGHVLLEDVPGTGKTKLAKALAKSMNGEYARIQFTPDLLPADITGLNVYNRQTNEFVLRKGPIFTNILLADEINRATPRTQAGLLECMEEKQATIDGETYKMAGEFFVIATQNPVETAGTFPLPEAQMDRFMMKLSMGALGRAQELEVLARYMEADPLDTLSSVVTLEDLQIARAEATKVYVHKCIQEYIVDLVAETRVGASVVMGVSPRGSLALLKCAKAYAALSGREYVVPDDVKAVAPYVLSHRIILGYGDNETDKFVDKILRNTDVPTEDYSA
ncbi:MAG: MoxR family ATPase [Lachnospiraceae bacterium]|nr:MoxR family ATPase [Lachnospiraceae bacterium]